MGVMRRLFRLRPWVFSLLVAALVLLASCAPAARPLEADSSLANLPNVVRPLEFEVLPEGTSLGKYNPPGAGATVGLSITAAVRNPNGYPLRLQSLDYEVFVNGVSAGQGVMTSPLALEPLGTGQVTFDVQIDLRRQPAVVREIAATFAGAALTFRLEAAVTVETLGYRATLARYSLFEGVTVATETVRAPELSLDESESSVFMLEAGLPVVRVVATVSNPGDIGYFIYGADLQLLFDGEPLARADMRPSPVPAGGESRIELLFYPDISRLPPSARLSLLGALEGGTVTAEVRGGLLLDVLGIDTYNVPPAWQIRGTVTGR